MATTKQKTLAEKSLPWVQIIAIILAGLWAIWFTYYYKEKIAPEAVPVNVSIDLKLQKTGVSLQHKKLGKKLAAIELSVAANNPSSHTTHLLPSIFIIYAYKIAYTPFGENPSLLRDRLWMNYCVLSSPTIVAWGHLFDYKEATGNDELKPGEVVATTFVFYVPVGEYDVIEAHASIPNGKDLSKIAELSWHKDRDYGLIQTLVLKSAHDTPEAIRRNLSDGYSPDPGGLQSGLQTAQSMKMMSLW
jgi:hypothetical protein